MALPRSLNFLRIGAGGQALEVYLDPICPYSAKIARSIDSHILPLISPGGKYDGKLQLIARVYAQPFHYLSHYHTEALLAFGQRYPDLFWGYLIAIFDTQRDFYNVPSQDLTGREVRDKLVAIATDYLEAKGKIDGPKSKVFGELRDALENKKGADGSTNGGNAAEWALKYTIKIGRQNGIHVTPTVLFDGLKEDSVSSSWGQEEWNKFLAAKLDQ